MFLRATPPYALAPDEKREWLTSQLHELVRHHANACPPYARVVDHWRRRRGRDAEAPEEFPFLPVGVFKEYALRSTNEPVMTLRSSATSTGTAATIYADKATRQRQSLSASLILQDFVGSERRPYLVFDLEKTVRGAEAMSARGAAIMSLAHLAADFHFVMTEQESGSLAIDPEALMSALDTIGDTPFLAYGFTYLLYQAHQQIAALGLGRPVHPESILLHSGGWKRLEAEAVDKDVFAGVVGGAWHLDRTRVIDFYGAVEQVGMLYPDCTEQLKHVPYWAEVIVRRADSLEPAGRGEPGLLQLISALPLSAPNHSVLTEDLGSLVLEDGCRCGRRGRAFVFSGRAPKSEIRGCSDVWRS